MLVPSKLPFRPCPLQQPLVESSRPPLPDLEVWLNNKLWHSHMRKHVLKRSKVGDAFPDLPCSRLLQWEVIPSSNRSPLSHPRPSQTDQSGLLRHPRRSNRHSPTPRLPIATLPLLEPNLPLPHAQAIPQSPLAKAICRQRRNSPPLPPVLGASLSSLRTFHHPPSHQTARLVTVVRELAWIHWR